MSVSDYDLIRNHIARYCHTVDRADAATITGFFWDDATLVFEGLHRGREAIRVTYETWIVRMRDPVQDLRHLIYSPAIRLKGDEAEAETYFDADGSLKRGGTPVRLRGLYRDRLTRRAEEWRFSRREIVVYDALED